MLDWEGSKTMNKLWCVCVGGGGGEGGGEKRQ